MKISENLSNAAGLSGLPVKDDRKVRPGKRGEFRSRLMMAEDANYEEHLQRLVEDIITQGERLAERVDIRELKIYKKLIAEFLDLVIGKSKKFSKRSLLDRRGRHRVYAIVKNINEELEQLTQDVLQEEKDNIRLLQRLADIRGLILDLFT
ncbi:MAG: YaaR family protein [Bacillota bacterium]|nr:YaaR family protein [Bacillota bacterium]HOA54790.1 YaaR family protein [Clostridiales bacterium]HPZ05198.1 YaaR family protein [Clostridiales bacterium]HQD31095.1 YaaR family protein [Clostridiales bacterium]